MLKPQSAIFQENSNQFYHLEYQLDPSYSAEKIIPALQHALTKQSDQINLVVAFGKRLWQQLNPTWTPVELEEFTTLTSPQGHTAPATQRDLLIWIHSLSHDNNFDQVLHIQNALSGIAELKLDLPGFTYHDSRDLIGFVDGTANPKEDQRQLAAVIPEGQVGAGGCYVLSQKWVHKLNDFNQLPVEKQEKVVGRTKEDDIELEGDAMPVDSHVSRTDVKVDGKAMKIYRRSAPYGSATESGLYFLSFACELERFSIQLKRMYGLTEDGITDKLIDFSDAVSSSYWFAPSEQDLARILN
ncbi:Dyp-type peroxidase [Oceanospirillum beijerinckii]|uniref:Dyp-type peroxidase n=1 Tax=Oceanospirillum beijerinckii TaxID=64976 RepID=UPI0004022C97|nr:Dyp-type peroxidase [Oceanospirillum beijerinckii]